MKLVEQCKNPIISIVTPFYNGGKTLMETANSVFNQTYPFFEWIIVDDGSKDKSSLNKLKELEKKDSRVRVFHKENEGPAAARDYGIANANKSSEFIYFLDADDYIEKNMLEVLYWALKTHPDASFAYTAMDIFGDAEFVWERYLSSEIEKKENVICISSMVKKEDLLEVGCFGIKEKAMYEDWNLWLKLLAKKKIAIRISAALFHYRFTNSGEFSRAKDNHGKAMSYINESAKSVSDDVKVYQFPYPGKKYDKVELDFDMTLPKFKSNKNGVLFLFPWMIFGGADIFNYELLRRLDKTKFNTYVCTLFPSENTLKDEFLKSCDELYDLSSFMEPSKYLAFVDYLIESRNINTIFVSNSKYAYYMVPYIKEKYPSITIIDYIHSNDFKDPQGGFGRCSFDVQEYIDKTLACNNFTKNQLINDFGVKNVETVYIGTNSDRFDPKKYNKKELKKKYKVPEGKIVVSMIARLSPEKRPLLFARIAKEITKQRTDIVFVMAGDGPQYSEVISATKGNNLIKVLGNVENPEEIHAISDISFNTSALEGLALTSYESLSMGVPVITSDVGGQTELIDESVGYVVHYNSKNGFKFDNNDVKNYIKGFNYVLKNLNELSKNCRTKILNKFSYDHMAKQIESLFNTKKIKKATVMNNSTSLIYQFAMEHLFDDCHYLYGVYYLKKYEVNIYDLEKRVLIENSKYALFKHKIKSRLKSIAHRYNLEKEFTYVLNFVRVIVSIFKSIIRIVKNTLFKIYSLIKFMFLSIISIPTIIYKIIKVRSK